MLKTLKITALYLLLVSVHNHYAVTLKGTILDIENEPIHDAEVKLYDEKGNLCIKERTGRDGTFTVTNCVEGVKYTVRVIPLLNDVWEDEVVFTGDKDTIEVRGVCGAGYGYIYGVVTRKDSSIEGRIAAAVTYDGPSRGEIHVNSQGIYRRGEMPSGQYNFYIGARGHTPVVVSNIQIYTERVTSNYTSLARVDAKKLSKRVREAAYAEKEGEFEKAIEIYEEVIRMQPCARAYGNRAFLRLRAEDYSNAIYDFIQGLKWEPGSEWLKMGLGEAYEFAGRSEAAVALYTELLKESPLDANIYRRRARARLATGETNEVMADLDMILQKNNKPADAHYQRARIMYQMGLLKKARDEINKSLKLEPENPDYHYFKAQLIYYTQTDDDAFNAVAEVLKIDPNHIPSLKLLGVLYIDKEHWAGAERTYTKVISHDLMDAQAYSGRGKARYKQEKYEDAKKDYERACRLSPSSILARLGLSNVLIEMKKYEHALSVLNQVLEMEPKDPLALYNRALVYRALGMNALADEDMKQRTLSIKERNSY